MTAKDEDLEALYRRYSPGITPELVGEEIVSPRIYPSRYQKAIDLHGYTREEALKKVEWFLRCSRSEEVLRVRIITGKGISSPFGPVLFPTIKAFLSLQKAQKRIVRYTGESGVFEVYL